MGASQSSTQTSIDVANSVVSNVAVGVITRNSTTASGDQTLDVECTDAAFAAATAACSADTMSRNSLLAAIAVSNPSAVVEMAKIKPDSCSMCSADNISMDMNVSVNVSAIADNTIANQIKSELSSKLQEAIDSQTKGGLGLTDTKVDANIKLKNYVENNFNTNIVNETLNTFAFAQTLKAKNMKLTNINMKLVATALGSAIVQNAIKNDSSVASLIDAATTVTTKNTGYDPLSFLSAYATAIIGSIMAFVGVIALIILLPLLRGGSSPIQPFQALPQGSLPGPPPSSPQQPSPGYQQPLVGPMGLQLPRMALPQMGQMMARFK
jgi:hypothetical protein